MNLSLFANTVVFALLLWMLSRTHATCWSLSRKVLLGMILGIVFGLGLQCVYGTSSPVIDTSVQWFDVVGNGYVGLLQMVVMPLVFVSILNAVARLHNATQLGKISLMTIGILLFTTAIAALIGTLLTSLFGLTASGLIQGEAETARFNAIQTNYVGKVADLSVPQLLLSFIPKNPFADLTGANPTSIISVVIFAAFLGMAALKLLKEDAPKGERVLLAIDTLQSWVMKLVRVVMLLTPYSVLTFAFTSRSSAASIPLNVEAQTRRLGVPKSIASFSASFGATIGQNGCAGLYPAMLATMIAPTVGINPLDPWWIVTLVGMVTISSVGVAGVGGGATFAALIVLQAMGLSITLAALLISVEPLIDMGRTALNVNGAMTAGTLTSQWLHQTDKAILNSKEHSELVQ